VNGDLCIANVYWMHDAEWFGTYGEAAVQIPVLLPTGAPAVYSPFLVLGSDAAVAAGRELYGQVKKQGTVSLESHSDLLVGRVERNGIDVITATMCWKQQRAEPGALEEVVPGSGKNVNLRIMPDGHGEFRRELLLREFGDVEAHEAWTGPATLEWRPNAQVPVHMLPIREVVLGLHRMLDLSLTDAETVHTYPSVGSD
jgi:acetoacetate decarboxylase